MVIYALLSGGQGSSVSLNDYTLFPAFENVAKHFGASYIKKKMGDPSLALIEELPHIQEEVIFITNFNRHWTLPQYDMVKAKMPNSKIVWLGSDTHYEGVNNPPLIDDGHDQFLAFNGLKNIEWPLDLYLDTMKNVSEEASIRFKSDHFYWSISESIIDQIAKCIPKMNIRRKERDGICLCSTENRTSIRHEMFKKIDETGLNVLRNLNEHFLCEIVKLYAESWVALGTTVSCMASDLRSMKGFRDWLAPFCGTVLIYDDYPDITDIGDFIPIYEYGQWGQIKTIVDELKSDLDRYHTLIGQQREWALENTLEKQFIRIFKEHLM